MYTPASDLILSLMEATACLDRRSDVPSSSKLKVYSILIAHKNDYQNIVRLREKFRASISELTPQLAETQVATIFHYCCSNVTETAIWSTNLHPNQRRASLIDFVALNGPMPLLEYLFDDLQTPASRRLNIILSAMVNGHGESAIEPQQALCDAITHDQPALLSNLLHFGADPNDLRSQIYMSPLQTAVRVGDLLAIQMLLDHQADPNIEQLGTNRPIVDAECLSDPRIARCLVRAGAVFEQRIHRGAVDDLEETVLHSSMTPLMQAVIRCDEDAVVDLLDQAVDILETDHLNRTVLHLLFALNAAFCTRPTRYNWSGAIANRIIGRYDQSIKTVQSPLIRTLLKISPATQSTVVILESPDTYFDERSDTLLRFARSRILVLIATWDPHSPGKCRNVGYAEIAHKPGPINMSVIMSPRSSSHFKYQDATLIQFQHSTETLKVDCFENPSVSRFTGVVTHVAGRNDEKIFGRPNEEEVIEPRNLNCVADHWLLQYSQQDMSEYSVAVVKSCESDTESHLGRSMIERTDTGPQEGGFDSV